LRGLTPTQRKFVKAGTIHGDFTMRTVRALKAKGLFKFVPTSPNGQCGPMVLTELGKAAQAALSRGEQS
jgi:hypothetical protein